MARPIKVAPAVDQRPAHEVTGPVESTTVDVAAVRSQAREAFASIDRTGDLPHRVAALNRRLHRLTLTKYHPDSGVRMTMALDFTLAEVYLPGPVETESAALAVETVFSLMASALHRAVAATVLDLADEMAAVLGGEDD
ncbi:hypothetical protein [Glycomyces xiaoerkulensis]|uniref:hypothetical protein n=1 Tax=Glycomyces xiaoerkulensis TaxID=2038139 RepID=UPI000C26B637|nr:hypothetical protein [Glycomyces xiaoerkulensis]